MVVSIDALMARYPGALTFRFGNSAEMSAQLLALVRAGRKRATCSSQADIAAAGAPPEVGRRDIALNWDGTPALVIETVELRPTRFADMTEDMALMEGENESLDGWRADHRAYFEREGTFAPDMLLLWERFEVVEDFG
ncbi:MAG: ASCH domain-containing protein [Pseudomonadota bacterium]